MRRSIPGLCRASARAGAFAALLAALLAAAPARADDPDFLVFSVGAFDFDDDETAAMAGLEYRSSYKLWVFKPFAGLVANSDGGAFGYAGILLDIYWGRRIVTTFSFAPGAYHDGDGKDLGSVLNFRSHAEISYRFDNRARLGVAINHLSHAGIGDDNPGVNSLILTYAMPLGGLFGR